MKGAEGNKTGDAYKSNNGTPVMLISLITEL